MKFKPHVIVKARELLVCRPILDQHGVTEASRFIYYETLAWVVDGRRGSGRVNERLERPMQRVNNFVLTGVEVFSLSGPALRRVNWMLLSERGWERRARCTTIAMGSTPVIPNLPIRFVGKWLENRDTHSCPGTPLRSKLKKFRSSPSKARGKTLPSSRLAVPKPTLELGLCVGCGRAGGSLRNPRL